MGAEEEKNTRGKINTEAAANFRFELRKRSGLITEWSRKENPLYSWWMKARKGTQMILQFLLWSN